jgi:membrane protease YdiL (CAAX protease family)
MDFEPIESQPGTATPAVEVPAREPFWGYMDLLLMIGFTVAAFLAIAVVTSVILWMFPAEKKDFAVLGLVLQTVFYILVYFGFRFTLGVRYGRPVMTSLGWRRTHFSVVLAMGGGVALAFLVGLIAGLLHTPQVSTPIDMFSKSSFTLVLFAVFAVVIAPVTEELFFRGFLQPLFSRTFGVIAGILITAVIFGGLHAPEYSWAWQYASAVAFAGAVFGWVRYRANSIIPSTIMHGCYNSVFLIAFLVSKHSKLP